MWLVMPCSVKLGMESTLTSTMADPISTSSLTMVSSSSRSGGEAASLRFRIDMTFLKMLVIFGIAELGTEDDGGTDFVKGQFPRCSLLKERRMCDFRVLDLCAKVLRNVFYASDQPRCSS